jgi:hypothetical protein
MSDPIALAVFLYAALNGAFQRHQRRFVDA